MAEDEGDPVSAPHVETQTESSKRESGAVVVEKRCLECGEVCIQEEMEEM